MTLPHHVAIIMDGNGRWAAARGLPRSAGHKVGAETLKSVLKHLKKRGVHIVTLYAFSSENWGRPKEEVDMLIRLFRQYLKNDLQAYKKENTRISFIGDRTKFPDDIINQMTLLEQETRSNNDFHVVLALSYGARDDIVSAIQTLAREVQEGYRSVESIDGAAVSRALSTANIPDPDFVIRTSGEERLSNFLLWEVAYAEFYWTPVLWPDFNEAEVDKALGVYATRKRRFGKV